MTPAAATTQPPSGPPPAAPAAQIVAATPSPPSGPAAQPPVTSTPVETTPEPPALPLLESPTETRASLPEAPGTALPETPAAYTERPDTPPEAVLREAIKLMDDLAGVKAAMALLAEQGEAPAAARLPSRAKPAPESEDPVPAQAPEPAPLAGGAPSSGAAGAAPSGGSGSAALYALMIALAALAGGLWGRLELVPVRWRSVAIVALNERPG